MKVEGRKHRLAVAWQYIEKLEAEGVPRAEGGRRIGVTGAAIYAWEKGHTAPCQSTAERIKKELKMPIAGREEDTLDKIMRELRIDPVQGRVLLALVKNFGL